ncbi:MAG: hypothetical protein RL258_706 [Pseudomonadota bacterium]|jgi:hypothetical protein
MEFAEVTLLVMIVAWFVPMGVLVSFLMWRYSAAELDAWVQSYGALSRKEVSRQVKLREPFDVDLNNIDLTKVTPSMLKPKVSSKRYSESVE